MKKKNIEMKIYELLGIKIFRKMAFVLRDVLFFPFTFWMGKERRKEFLYNTASNYIMKKGNGLQDLRDFKWMLLFNAFFHIYALIDCLPDFIEAINSSSIFYTIVFLIPIIINLYCIMLQRYNHIRINQVLKNGKQKEQNKICKELEKNKHLSKEYTYKVINKNNKEKNIEFEEFLKIATPEQLKVYRNFLIEINNKSEQSSMNLEIPINKRKKLVLEYKNKH